MDQRAILDHQFTVAAYAITWIIQLGYLAWLAVKWRARKRNLVRNPANPR
jgi:threonine/homoserine/homoserine lactone efflux protein